MAYTVKQLADLAGISVRTLHHYDEIGLLKPSQVKPNGYRFYEMHDLIKLQQILFFRELEFPLHDIKKMITSPHFDIEEALHDHKKIIQLKKARLEKLLTTITNTLTTMKKKSHMKEEKLYGSFTKEQIEKYKAEVREKWGEKALKQSEERMKKWNAKDYDRIQKEGEAIVLEIAARMEKGPADAAIQAQIEKYYDYMNNFYDCSYTIFRGLGKLYIQDARFTAYYEKYRLGLAQFMHDAIQIFCDAHGENGSCNS